MLIAVRFFNFDAKGALFSVSLNSSLQVGWDFIVTVVEFGAGPWACCFDLDSLNRNGNVGND